MNKNSIDDYVITYHFLERYVYRFQDNRLENIFRRIERMQRLTNQQYNRVKKHTDRAKKKHLRIDGDFIVLVKNNVLITCWLYR